MMSREVSPIKENNILKDSVTVVTYFTQTVIFY